MNTKDSINFVVGFFAVSMCVGLLSVIVTYVYLTANDKPITAAFSNIVGQVLGVVSTFGGVMLKVWIDKMPGPAPTPTAAPAAPEKRGVA